MRDWCPMQGQEQEVGSVEEGGREKKEGQETEHNRGSRRGDRGEGSSKNEGKEGGQKVSTGTWPCGGQGNTN